MDPLGMERVSSTAGVERTGWAVLERLLALLPGSLVLDRTRLWFAVCRKSMVRRAKATLCTSWLKLRSGRRPWFRMWIVTRPASCQH